MVDFPDIRNAKRIALDVETCDPDLKKLGPGVRRDGYVVGVSVCVENGPSNYYPIRHTDPMQYGELNLAPQQVIDYLKDNVCGDDKEIVGANLLYDADYLEAEGVKLNGKFLDVQVAEPLIDEDKRGEYSLGDLSNHYLGKGKDEEELYQWLSEHFGGKPTRAAQAGRIHLAPPSIVAPYAISDGENPLAIMRKQEAILNPELLEIFELERDLMPMLLAMRQRGVRLDVDAAETAQETMQGDVAEKRTILEAEGISVWTAATIQGYCEKAGIPFSVTPKNGQMSVTKAWLDKHNSDPVIAAIESVRRAEKSEGTFIQGLLRHSIDGRVHCLFNQLNADDYGTVSGRFSSSNPNLQNIPARDKIIGPLLRGLFVPDYGEDWGCADYSQIEYRMLVYFAAKVFMGDRGSAKMLRKFVSNPKTDMHTAVGELCGIDRDSGKTINFGMVYGLGEASLMMRLGKSKEECRVIIDKYNDMMPFAKDLYKYANKIASKRGWIRTLGGRQRRFQKWEPRVPWQAEDPGMYEEWMEYGKDNRWHRNNSKRPKAYRLERAKEEYGAAMPLQRSHCHTALNALLQGSAADIMKKGMADIWRSGVCDVLGAPLLTLHDELDWSIPRTKEGREAFAEANRIMEGVYRDRMSVVIDDVAYQMPLVVDSDTGRNWAECK